MSILQTQTKPKRGPGRAGRRLFSAAGLLLLLLLPLAARPAEILTDDGQVFRGRILSENAGSILMAIEDGVEVRIEKSEITYVERGDKAGKPGASQYPVLGLTFGTPAVFNGVAGYYWPGFGAKVSAGYWVEFWGAQADLSKSLAEGKGVRFNLSLVAGYAGSRGGVTSYQDWSYYGLGLDLEAGGLALELDAVSGDKPDTLAFPFQIGYIHAFN